MRDDLPARATGRAKPATRRRAGGCHGNDVASSVVAGCGPRDVRRGFGGAVGGAEVESVDTGRRGVRKKFDNSFLTICWGGNVQQAQVYVSFMSFLFVTVKFSCGGMFEQFIIWLEICTHGFR